MSNKIYPTVLVQGMNDSSVRVVPKTDHSVISDLNGVYKIQNNAGIFTVDGLDNSTLKGELEVALEEHFKSDKSLPEFNQEFYLPFSRYRIADTSKKMGRTFHGMGKNNYLANR